jgi:hypothetical protein
LRTEWVDKGSGGGWPAAAPRPTSRAGGTVAGACGSQIPTMRQPNVLSRTANRCSN